MADSGNNTDGCGVGWWGNFLAAAKDQTGKVYEMVSQDLTEFTSTMQTDTKHVVEKTKETLQTSTDDSENLNTADRMKQSFHSLMSGITKALTIEPEDTSPPKQTVSQPGTGIFDRAKARKRAIQVDTGTYLQEPSGPQEKYADYLKSFDLDSHKGEISDLLVTMVEVRSLYTTLVPSQVSHQDFWRRYFYKVHQLHVDEERKKALMKRAERVDVKEDTIDWDEEEWSGDEDATPSKKSPQSAKREDPTSRLQSADTEEGKAMSEKPADLEQAKSVQITSETDLKCETSEEISTSARKKLEGDDNLKNNDKMDNNILIATSDGSKPVKQEGADEDRQSKENKVTDIVTDAVDNCDKSNETELGTKKQDSSVQDQSKNLEKRPEKGQETVETVEPEKDTKEDSEACDNDTNKKEDNINEKELKTKVKGDMVVVGDRISPSSDSSDNKDSNNDDWEHDFDVDVTPDDLAAASELAQKMNMSAGEYNKLTGGEDDDWENWD